LLTEQYTDRFNEYVFAPESYEPLCRFDGEGFETYHNDHLGTPHELTDEKGDITWSVSYDVYGGVGRRYVGKSDNRIRFQGQYDDSEIELHYNFFRYYDPELGRYNTQDPIGLFGGFNPYEYSQNPLAWIDPLGLETKKRPSAFESTERRQTTIYEVVDPNNNMQPVYVGKTYQKDGGSAGLDTRFGQHEKAKADWANKGYEIREVKSGNWTDFETATHEMRAITDRGGVRNKLTNRNRPITPKKFKKYQHLHTDYDPKPHGDAC